MEIELCKRVLEGGLTVSETVALLEWFEVKVSSSCASIPDPIVSDGNKTLGSSVGIGMLALLMSITVGNGWDIVTVGVDHSMGIRASVASSLLMYTVIDG